MKGRSDYDALAKEAVGNWRQFESFGWHAAPDDADEWCIVHTVNRDSGLLEQSNAEAIEAALKEHLEADDPDIAREHCGHWAIGWVDGYSIRVYNPGTKEPTEAFKAWCDLSAALEEYPVLDEEDLSRREYEATVENIESVLHDANRNDDFMLPDDAASQVWSYLWDNDQGELECRDGHGGYPSVESVRTACDELGWRILYVVRYVDCGEVVEEYEYEDEARERVLALRQAGFVEAAYAAETPELAAN